MASLLAGPSHSLTAPVSEDEATAITREMQQRQRNANRSKAAAVTAAPPAAQPVRGAGATTASATVLPTSTPVNPVTPTAIPAAPTAAAVPGTPATPNKPKNNKATKGVDPAPAVTNTARLTPSPSPPAATAKAVAAPNDKEVVTANPSERKQPSSKAASQARTNGLKESKSASAKDDPPPPHNPAPVSAANLEADAIDVNAPDSDAGDKVEPGSKRQERAFWRVRPRMKAGGSGVSESGVADVAAVNSAAAPSDAVHNSGRSSSAANTASTSRNRRTGHAASSLAPSLPPNALDRATNEMSFAGVETIIPIASDGAAAELLMKARGANKQRKAAKQSAAPNIGPGDDVKMVSAMRV